MPFQKARALQEAEKSVAQGKISQAIRQYQAIFENDPADLSLLNTIGDLYVRDRNAAEGLRQFHRLAEAYVREGFNLKAIAIYRKISKIDPGSTGNLLKLAELYQLQGLTREAREHYVQCAEYFRKRNQSDRVVEIVRKLVLIEPENLNFRRQLADEYEGAGKRETASQVHLESAEILLRRQEQTAAETALVKAAELDPNNAKIPLIRAQLAVARQQPAEAEKLILSIPGAQADPVAKRILLDAYLGAGKCQEVLSIVQEVFQTNPSDFAPVSATCALLVQEGHVEDAYRLLAGMAQPAVTSDNAAPVIEALRRVSAKAPSHIPTLELTYDLCERTADEASLPEVLEALGRAYEQAGELRKADGSYAKLIAREPENINYRALRDAVQQKLGNPAKLTSLSGDELALAGQDEGAAGAEGIDARQKLMVDAALENSDLFARYNLAEKAIQELEKVLHAYPDQVDIHRRILEIARKALPARAAAAAAQLARIYAAAGNSELSTKYHAIVQELGGETVLPPREEPKPSPEVIPPALTDAGTADETSGTAAAPAAPVTTPEPVSTTLAAPRLSADTPVDLSQPEQATEEAEIDLSGELGQIEMVAAEPALAEGDQPAAAPAISPAESAPPADQTALTPACVPEPLPAPAETQQPSAEATALPGGWEEETTEIEFYLNNGFTPEARSAIASLAVRCPENPVVAALRGRLDALEKSEAAPAREQAAPANLLASGAPAAELERWEGKALAPAGGPGAERESPAVPPPELHAAPPESEAPATTVTQAPAVRETASLPEPLSPFESPPRSFGPAREPSAMAGREAPPALTDLAADLSASIEDSPAAPEAPATADAEAGSSAAPLDQLSALLADMDEMAPAGAAPDDPEMHYNLGVAFREMRLLDEAIGEFQKVVKGVGGGVFPPNFLQACSLLAICFMEKNMPAIAVRWYTRALETPGLHQDALLSLQYDLGLAYERAGDVRHALESFTEVYSQNIDFRDVAEKIRELQPKV